MTKGKKDKPEVAGKAAQARQKADETHVPEEAENFEHTLRRLTVEKQKARKGSFGLYR